MAELNVKEEIGRYDKALAEYYNAMGRNDYYDMGDDKKGKFEFYCEDNGFDEFEWEDWNEEMKLVEDGDTECLLLGFDENFPYNSTDKNDNEMKQKLIEILKLIKNKQEIPITEQESTQLDVSMFKDITDQMVDDNLAKYSNQMPSFIQVADKDKELKWFLGVSDQIGYPFLSYMVDSFTMDRAKMNDNEKKPLHINQWVSTNKFVKALTNNNKVKGNKLKQAMASYSNRLMNRLHIGSPTFRIVDDLKEVTEYLVSIAKFIKNLMTTESAVVKPPFQVDLMIAVKNVTKVVSSDADDADEEDDDDEDETDMKVEDPKIDHIGPVRDRLKQYPILHFPKEGNPDRDETAETVDSLYRLLGKKYEGFRTALSKVGKGGGGKRGGSGNNGSPEPDISFDAKIYPQFRRFSIFVDRRAKKPKLNKEDEKENKEQNLDQITFFQPPDGYSTMPTGHVPEIGFEFLRKCLLPQRIQQKEKNITALQGLCGQLLTFMFNVEQVDEIKCYIIWNGQTMRFEYEHITQVLPYLFNESDDNKAFKKKGGSGEELIGMYQEQVSDIHFRKFYDRLYFAQKTTLMMAEKDNKANDWKSFRDGNLMVAQIDKNLGEYYKEMGKNDYYNEQGFGKFLIWAEDNTYEDDSVQDEIIDADLDPDCLAVDFEEDFPLDQNIDGDEKKIQIHKILKQCVNPETQQILPTPKPPKPMKVNVNMFKDVTDQMVDDGLAKYETQMQSFIKVADKDAHLKHYLGASDHFGFPFLTYMVDSFTMDKAKENEKTGKPLPIQTWAMRNKFMQSIKNKNRTIELTQAMTSYSNRLMNRLHIGAPTFTIVDDLKEITEYLVSIGKFIKTLMENKSSVVKPPFQVDLMIAVQDVMRVVKSETATQDDDQDDEVDDTDTKIEDPSIDHVGPVRSKLKQYPLLHFPKKNVDANLNDTTETVKALARLIGQRYKDFRTALSAAAGKENKGKANDDQKDESNIYPDLQFNDAIYPQYRRFSIFVDRRKKKPKQDQDEKDKDKDQITFFQPPTMYSTMPTGHVPEIGFEFLRNCLIPDKNKNVTALQGLCGQLLTFMYNVEQIDEIKCYIVWNGQTMRFEYEHITQVLPYLFVKNKKNDEFKKKGGAGDKLTEEYRENVEDKQFRLFYQTLLDWKLE